MFGLEIPNAMMAAAQRLKIFPEIKRNRFNRRPLDNMNSLFRWTFFFENEIDMILTICGGEEIHRNERKVVRDGEREREHSSFLENIK